MPVHTAITDELFARIPKEVVERALVSEEDLSPNSSTVSNLGHSGQVMFLLSLHFLISKRGIMMVPPLQGGSEV